jgi:hypothetical protein
MVDFVEALRSGIDAAEVAEKNKQEIAGVFGELNRQLADGFDGQVLIGTGTARNLVTAILNVTTRYGRGAIFASNPKKSDEQSLDLAGWYSGVNGYPCIIALLDREVSCEDRQALEETLKQMLASPDVGGKIRRLIEPSAVLA